MYNNRAINALRSLGIWIPGYPVTNKEAALRFWGEVFGWEAEATTRNEKLQRLAVVEKLVANLGWSLKPEFRVFLEAEYYWKNKAVANRFWRAVETEIEMQEESLSWYWVQTERKHKGLCWGDIIPNEEWVIKSSKTKKTPQRREETKVVSETPQGGGFNSIDEVL